MSYAAIEGASTNQQRLSLQEAQWELKGVVEKRLKQLRSLAVDDTEAQQLEEYYCGICQQVLDEAFPNITDSISSASASTAGSLVLQYLPSPDSEAATTENREHSHSAATETSEVKGLPTFARYAPKVRARQEAQTQSTRATTSSSTSRSSNDRHLEADGRDRRMGNHITLPAEARC